MEIDRKKLLTVLETCAPGLGKDVIPALACFCFHEKTVTTFNDDVAFVASSVDLPWDCGLRGDAMLQWLRQAPKDTVSLQFDENVAMLRCGRTRLQLAMLPADDFVFVKPEDPKQWIEVSDEFYDAIRVAAHAIGTDHNHTWRLGILICFGDKFVTFYSTDNIVAVCKRLKMKTPDWGTVQLMPPFVKLLTGKVKPKRFSLTDQFAIVEYDDGTRAYGRCADVDDETLQKMRELFKQHDWKSDRFVEIGEKMVASMKRVLWAQKASEHKQCNARVRKGTLTLSVQAGSVEVEEKIKTDHADINAAFPADVVSRVFPDVTALEITPNYVAMRSPGTAVIVSTIEE